MTVFSNSEAPEREPQASKSIIISGASSGFGAMTARALADAGHNVYAGIRDTQGRNADAAADVERYANDNHVAVRPVELDVSSDRSVDSAIAGILSTEGRIDVVVHNAGHMVLGPAESFTCEQLASLYDVNVLGAHRLNRAVLPSLRAQGSGLLVWAGSSSTRGGTPPFLGPYFAAKAAEDALAVSYADELVFGITADYNSGADVDELANGIEKAVTRLEMLSEDSVLLFANK